MIRSIIIPRIIIITGINQYNRVEEEFTEDGLLSVVPPAEEVFVEPPLLEEPLFLEELPLLEEPLCAVHLLMT